jgi:hypothetical protein
MLTFKVKKNMKNDCSYVGGHIDIFDHFMEPILELEFGVVIIESLERLKGTWWIL